jgi:hypothetical protein
MFEGDVKNGAWNDLLLAPGATDDAFGATGADD